MAGGRRERGAHDLEPGSAAQPQPELDAGAAGPGPSVPAGVLVIHDAGWHPAFGLDPGPESPRVLAFSDIDRRQRDRVPRLRCDVDRRGGELDTTRAGHAETHGSRPSRPRLASGASGAPAMAGPARSAGADVVSAIQRAQRRQGEASKGWLEQESHLSRSPHGEPSRAVSGDVGGLAVAVLAAAGVLWLSLMAWAWWG
jgi:hypothetical protein